MPMIDAFIPVGALTPAAEQQLIAEITDALIRREGLDPTNPDVREVSVLYLHRPAIHVGGTPADLPRYRFMPTVPEGQYDDAVREAVVLDITLAVARAEARPVAEVAPRVWVFPTEMPDGSWGARGRILRLGDILGRLAAPAVRERGLQRLARLRSCRASPD